MNFDWILVAEGVGADAKGAVTAIGINQNIVIADTLPSVTKRAVIAHFVDRDGTIPPGTEFDLLVNIISPSGKVIAAQTARGKTGEPPWPGLPSGIDFPADLALRLPELGTYRIAVSMELPDDRTIDGEIEFHVVKPTDG